MKTLSPSASLANKVLHAAMTRIGAVEDGISRADLREWLASNVEFTEWESEIYQRYNSTRWWTVLNFISTAPCPRHSDPDTATHRPRHRHMEDRGPRPAREDPCRGTDSLARGDRPCRSRSRAPAPIHRSRDHRFR